MRVLRGRLLLLVLLLAAALGVTGAEETPSAPEYPPFQPLVDAMEPGGVLKPPPGVYAGPVVVDAPIIIDGGGQVTIDNGGKGTVMLLDTDGAQVRNMTLRNSGRSFNDIDSGIQVRGNYNVIKDNVIEDTLFGVDLQQSENNVVRRNEISSKNVSLGLRGDGVRMWYSFGNTIEDNEIHDSRDNMVVWYSRDNVMRNNTATRGRYSMHFMYSQYNLVENNRFWNNSVGIFIMYSDSVVIRNNHVSHATGATGIGIGFKETSDNDILNNEILYCANGLYLDLSPWQPDSTNRITNNLVAYNGVGVQFLSDWTGNVFKENTFTGNLTQVAVSGAKSAKRNIWDGNYWDDYQGFDQNNDGVGDTPHQFYAYADRIWMDVPSARFFKGSPVLEVIDFLERLAPFSTPELVLKDERPLIHTGTVQ